MSAVICGDNRFEIIAKVKEHLLEATNINMQPKELEVLDSILFRLWQLGYFEKDKQIEELEKKLDFFMTETVAGKEYRPKEEVEDLKAQIEELKKQLAITEHDREHNDYELAETYKKITELEAQIEKMKCCGNCKHSRTEYEHCRTNKHEKWELAE